MAFKNTRRAMVFPGQGSQYVGMGKKLAEQHPVAKGVFQEVDDALGTVRCFSAAEELHHLGRGTCAAATASPRLSCG